VQVLLSVGGVIVTAALFSYIKPERAWRWAVASILIPLFLSAAMRSQNWLSFAVVVAVGVPWLLLSLAVAYTAVFVKYRIQPSQRPQMLHSDRANWWLAAALALPPAIIQISFLSHSNSTFTSVFLLIGGIFFIEGLAFSLWKRERVWRWALALNLGFIVIIMGRIVFDGLRDPTSHNLWPFEIITAIAVAGPTTFFGAYAGAFVNRLTSRQRNARDHSSG
jgi:hypothetical protein